MSLSGVKSWEYENDAYHHSFAELLRLLEEDKITEAYDYIADGTVNNTATFRPYFVRNGSLDTLNNKQSQPLP